VPAELSQVDISGFEESGAYLYIKDAKGLVAMVQMGVLEIHPWNAHVDRPDRPDQVIFDLDPAKAWALPRWSPQPTTCEARWPASIS
jgi:bifunctional non-homologous end joining protein LigD